MKLVIPMAGLGTRMRPHTWSRPKPLLPIAGKPMLGHILERFKDLPIDEYVFIVGYLGEQIREYVEENYDIPAHFAVQEEMLGQAHALWLAREHLEGPIFMMFVDTLFDGADFSNLDEEGLDGIIYTKKVEDPRRFGVVELNENGRAVNLIEKPDTKENKQVLIGLYYFRDGAWLARASEELMDRQLKTKGEYYIADAITLMIEDGANFYTRTVDVWRDTGKPETTFETHRYILEHGYDNSAEAVLPGVTIIPPVYVHPEATVERSVIGPYVSVHQGAEVRDSVLRDTIVDEEAEVEGLLLAESILGRHVELKGSFRHLNLGDNATYAE